MCLSSPQTLYSQLTRPHRAPLWDYSKLGQRDPSLGPWHSLPRYVSLALWPSGCPRVCANGTPACPFQSSLCLWTGAGAGGGFAPVISHACIRSPCGKHQGPSGNTNETDPSAGLDQTGTQTLFRSHPSGSACSPRLKSTLQSCWEVFKRL